MKKLLVLGGTLISCEIVKAAKKMGLYVIVADYNEREYSPAKKIADEDFCISATDVDAIVELIKREKVDGVITGFADVLLPYYAEICDKAGLPCYGDKKNFEIFTNKKIYKQLCKEFDIPIIEDYSLEEAESGDIQFPVLVKPIDNSGSRGITICNGVEDLKEAYDYAQTNSKSGEVLVEPYVDANECTVFWLFVDGRYYVSVIGNRHMKLFYDNLLPLPVGYSYPANITDKYISETYPNFCRMLNSIDVKNGMMFVQCKVVDSVCYAYDIGYRLTGSLEYINLYETCGYNPLEMMINFAIYGKMTDEEIDNKIDPYLHGRYAYNVSCLANKGTIREIKGIETVLNYPFVDRLFLSHLPGERITEEMEGRLSQIAIRVLGHADSKDDVYDCMREIHDGISILSEDNQELLMDGLNEGDLMEVLC